MISVAELKKLASQSGWSPKARRRIKRKYKKSLEWDQAKADEWFNEWRQRYCNESFDREELYNGKILYKLTDGCIFDRNHKDAAVVIRTDGQIGYNCFHDSCADYHWSDFKAYYEPGSNKADFWNEGR